MTTETVSDALSSESAPTSAPQASTAANPPTVRGDRIAVVTGASRGIGAATVDALVADGWTVAAVARSESGLAEVVSRHTGRVFPVVLDVTDGSAVRDAVAQIEATNGPIQLLVNNAGYGLRGSVEDVPVDDIRTQFEVNVFAAIGFSQAVLPAMRARRRGTIIMVSSVQGRVTLPFSGIYGSSKFALEGASDSMRMEVAPFGVRVTLVEPGPVRTDFAAQAASLSDGVLNNQDSAYYPAYSRYLSAKEKINKSACSKEAVAALIARVASKRKPRARYGIQIYAHILPWLSCILPRRVSDYLLMRPFRKALKQQAQKPTDRA